MLHAPGSGRLHRPELAARTASSTHPEAGAAQAVPATSLDENVGCTRGPRVEIAKKDHLDRTFRLDLCLRNAQDKELLRWLRAGAYEAARLSNALSSLMFVGRQLWMKTDPSEEDRVAVVMRAEQNATRRAFGDRLSSYVTDAVHQAVAACYAKKHGVALARCERVAPSFAYMGALRIRLGDKNPTALRQEGSRIIFRCRLFTPSPIEIRCDPGSLIRKGEIGTEGQALILGRLLSGEYKVSGAAFDFHGHKPAVLFTYHVPLRPHQQGGHAVLSAAGVLSYGERNASFSFDLENLMRRLALVDSRRRRILRSRRKQRVGGRRARRHPCNQERALLAKAEGIRRTSTQQIAAALLRAANGAGTLLLPNVEQARTAHPDWDLPWAQLFFAISSRAEMLGVQCSQVEAEDKHRSILRTRRLQTRARRQINRGFGVPSQSVNLEG